jgi:hypothetical protein
MLLTLTTTHEPATESSLLQGVSRAPTREEALHAQKGHEDTQSRGPSCLPHYSLQDHLRQADAVCNGLTLNYHVECTVITRVLC